jgi:hypothetical protein
VDDDPNTYWHSPWKDPLYLPEDEYGHWFQIKLEKPLNEELCFRYWTRNSPRTTPWTIKMLASSDNGNSWDEVAFVDGDLPLAGGNWMSPVYDLPKAKVTDLRFCVIRIENFGYSDNRCGFDPGACTCIAGFRVWGQ